MDYDLNNREERAVCAHLFRLLLNSVHNDNGRGFFAEFLRCIEKSSEAGSPLALSIQNTPVEAYRDARVYTEVTLVRDSLAAGGLCSRSLQQFCDDHNKRIGIDGVTWTPKQLVAVKPDMAIVLPGLLIVIEAKFVLRHDDRQLNRTKSLLDVWQKLLVPMRAIGLDGSAGCYLITVGGCSDSSSINWTSISNLADQFFKPSDPSVRALKSACTLLESPDPERLEHHDDTGIGGEYVNLDGLAALRQHLEKRWGGYVGFVGGEQGLEVAASRPGYLEERRYKWLSTVDENRYTSRNWVPVSTFFKIVDTYLSE